MEHRSKMQRLEPSIPIPSNGLPGDFPRSHPHVAEDHITGAGEADWPAHAGRRSPYPAPSGLRA